MSMAMTILKLNLIGAACENMGIGINGTLPWKLKNEMHYFSKMTSLTKDPTKINAVIMGRRSWDCIPSKYRPLPRRLNIVLTRTPEKLRNDVPDDVVVCGNLDEVIKYINNNSAIENAWVIGGSEMYKLAMEHPNCHRIYYTDIRKYYECDTFFPPINMSRFRLLVDHGDESDLVPVEKQEEEGVEYYFKIYEKIH